ncbi:MAG: ABC transporter substrate-binding protein [Azospirillaceae bacterium]|nr:ABC transporter substrate-binding protein [Azospirillaceae bacterium]
MRQGLIGWYGAIAVILLGWASPVRAQDGTQQPVLIETPMFAADVAAGRLPPIAERLPRHPLVSTLSEPWQTIGVPGGSITSLMARAKDNRLMTVYGYARLIGYTSDFRLVPDILESFDVDDDRVFTFHLRPGHRWSDGYPFTSDDFRYWWQDVANNPDLSPLGLPVELLVDGEAPKVEFPDAETVRYRWSHRNPGFLPQLAAARPLTLFLPAHYLKQFDARYTAPDVLAAHVAAFHQRNWVSLHMRQDSDYDFDNPDSPTLQPWRVTNAAPADRFVFVRNPYYHRIDPAGHQLPYLDRVVLAIADSNIIPAKTGGGESDLQARYIRFSDYTFLSQAAERNNYHVELWKTGVGSQLALFPNLTTSDPKWRPLMRDVRFRRALSLAIDREELNEVIYFGLGLPGNNTVLPSSPLYSPELRNAWANYDPVQASHLLDEVGLVRRNSEGIRLLPDGSPAEIVVASAGESSEESDVLELIADTWRKVGIKLFVKQSQLDVFRTRLYAGDTVMSISRGLDNAVATPEMSPDELAPVDQANYQWPRWGQYFQTGGQAGEAVDLPTAWQLLETLHRWRVADNDAERRHAWETMLRVYADQQFSIGLVADSRQPVVIRNNLHNLPTNGLFSWNPGSQFGIYRLENVWQER